MRVAAVSLLLLAACSNVWLPEHPVPRTFVFELRAELSELPPGSSSATVSIPVPTSYESQEVGRLSTTQNGGTVASGRDRFGNRTLTITGAPNADGPLSIGYRILVTRYRREAGDPGAETGETDARSLWLAPVSDELREHVLRLTSDAPRVIDKLRVLADDLRQEAAPGARARELVEYCHALDLPASLESGYRLPESGAGPLERPATWVRVLVPGLGWQAIDLATSEHIGDLDHDRIELSRGVAESIPARARADHTDVTARLRTRVRFGKP